MTRRPRILDLFCGAGGAGMGYHKAGFDVVGVDVEPQPHYPFEFYQADALTFPLDGFDAVHASPPCQSFTVYRNCRPGAEPKWPDLVDPTRDRLIESGLPWIMENVPGAPLRDPVRLCGTSFGMPVRRHRLFEASFPPDGAAVCPWGFHRTAFPGQHEPAERADRLQHRRVPRPPPGAA